MLELRESDECPNCGHPDLVSLGGHGGDVPIIGYVCIKCWWEEIDPECLVASRMANALAVIEMAGAYNASRVDGDFINKYVREAFMRISRMAGDAIEGLSLIDIERKQIPPPPEPPPPPPIREIKEGQLPNPDDY